MKFIIPVLFLTLFCSCCPKVVPTESTSQLTPLPIYKGINYYQKPMYTTPTEVTYLLSFKEDLKEADFDILTPGVVRTFQFGRYSIELTISRLYNPNEVIKAFIDSKK